MKFRFDEDQLSFPFIFDGEDGADEAGTDDNGAENGADNGAKDGEKKYTDDDLDRIINKRFAKWQKQKDKEVDEAKKLADMNAQEQADHYKAELEALQHKNAVAEMEKTAREMLQKDDINVENVLVESLVGEDAESTNAKVKAFAKAFKAAVLAGVKAELAHKKPAAGTGSSVTGGMTKEQYYKMLKEEKSATKRQELIKKYDKQFR